MKIVIDRSKLLKSLGHVQSVVEKRNTIPILANVKLDANNGSLRLTATDMDIAMVESVGAAIEQTAATTVPAHMFYDIVRKLPEGAEVEISNIEDEKRLAIRAANSNFTLSCLPVEDFPVMAEGEFEFQFTVTQEECKELIDKTRFAISTEETRYYLNGIYLHAAGEEGSRTLRSVATDGHRLAQTEITLPAGADKMPGVIVPRKTVMELKKLLEEAGADIEISVSNAKIRFVCGDAVLVSKLIDGTFPDYERVIPADNNRPMEVDNKRLIQAVDRVSTIASDKSRAIKLKLENGTLNLFADNQDSGVATESIEVSYSAEPMEIGFNSRYLLDMLGQIEGETVQFLFGDTSAPAVVRDPADIGALYVIMPMRI